MSSLAVRTLVKNFLTTNAPTEHQVDFSAQYLDLPDLLEQEDLTVDDPWLGLQFVGGDEQPATLPATNVSGRYRETGVIYLHVVEVAKPQVIDSILARAETLRNLFRGQRIGTLLVESITPVVTDSGGTLELEGGFVSGSFLISYYYDLNL